MNYAQLNEQYYCIGLSTLSGEVIHPDMILLSDSDNVQLGQKYDRQNNVWLDEFMLVEPQVPQLTLEDVQSNVAETKTVAMNTEGTVMMTSEDALTIMEYQAVLDEKLSKIITHLVL